MKSTIASIVFSLILIGSVYVITRDGAEKESVAPVNNVSMIDGVQIIELKAKGGYVPRKSIAKAGIPTVLKIDTQGTFDCSSAVRIPSMNISENLPPSGTKEIALNTPEAGILNGTCSMGMFPFEIEFQK